MWLATPFFAKDIRGNHSWMRRCVATLTKHVYITIDVDGLDPSLMPATGTPEPGGLGWYDILGLLKRVARERKIVGFDLAELSPRKGTHCADVSCAKLAYKIIDYIHR